MDKYVIGVQFRGKNLGIKIKITIESTYTDIKPQIIPKISVITWNNFGIIIISSETSLIIMTVSDLETGLIKCKLIGCSTLKWRLTA